MEMKDGSFPYRFFKVFKGREKSYFIQKNGVSVHLVVLDEVLGGTGIFVCYPSGNSAVSLFLKDVGVHVKFLDAKYQDGFQRIKFKVFTDANSICIKKVFMDSIRFLRDLIKGRGISHKPYHVSIEGNKIEISHKTLDGKNLYSLFMCFDGEVRICQEDGAFYVVSPCGCVSFDVVSSVNFHPLTPYKEEDLIEEDVLKKVYGFKKGEEKKFDLLKKAIDTLGFLVYKEKMLAGSWRFLTYFGRDTLISLLCLSNVLKADAFMSALQSVLDRMREDGSIAHEEGIGSYAVRKNVERGEENLHSPIYDYEMVDDDFLLPIVLSKFIDSKGVFAFRNFAKASFSGEKNILRILKNAELILRKAYPFYQEQRVENLIRIPLGSRVGDWRDSEGGLGGGVYPVSINAFMVQTSLKAILKILGVLDISEYVNKFPFLKRVWEDKDLLEDMICRWGIARDMYKIYLSSLEISKRLSNYLDVCFDDYEKDFILRSDVGGVSLEDFVYKRNFPFDGMQFYALSLGEDGRAIEVLNSDVSFWIFIDDPPKEDMLSILKFLFLPFPMGLYTPVGILVSNPALSQDSSLFSSLDKTHYHGSVFWSWHISLLEIGLLKQLKRFYKNYTLVSKIKRSLSKIEEIKSRVGMLFLEELWSFKILDDYEAVSFGEGKEDETMSNSLQLWSTLVLASIL